MTYLRMHPMDLIALVAYLHVSLMWYVSVTFLSNITPRSRTFSVRSMTVLSMNSFSMLGVLVNRDVKKITSVFSALLLSVFWVFHCITSSMQGWKKDKNPVEEMQREKKTLQIYRAEKYTSAHHACCMRKGFLYIIKCHRHKTKS